VQNAMLALDHQTHVNCGEEMHHSHLGMKNSNYKEILNMKYPSKVIKPLFMVVCLMKLNAHSISNS
jgi:hypothetical protein